ncbi:hypothetical protein [Pseudoclavibacter terrae]|uniref:hypothetical protein n=1 Tax=Pseudoclavibacter terrae TaxID=1530195 RepID=UPI001FCA56D4|nr:hypothetical protein [Pseudoclavibacter terrae]
MQEHTPRVEALLFDGATQLIVVEDGEARARRWPLKRRDDRIVIGGIEGHSSALELKRLLDL